MKTKHTSWYSKAQSRTQKVPYINMKHIVKMKPSKSVNPGHRWSHTPCHILGHRWSHISGTDGPELQQTSQITNQLWLCWSPALLNSYPSPPCLHNYGEERWEQVVFTGYHFCLFFISLEWGFVKWWERGSDVVHSWVFRLRFPKVPSFSFRLLWIYAMPCILSY